MHVLIKLSLAGLVAEMKLQNYPNLNDPKLYEYTVFSFQNPNKFEKRFYIFISNKKFYSLRLLGESDEAKLDFLLPLLGFSFLTACLTSSL